MRRYGWTLHEMIISLSVLGIIVGLASNAAAGQLRFFRGIGALAAVRTQTGHASAIVQRVLWGGGVSPAAGDVRVALDTAIEVRVTSGMAVLCADGIGAYSVTAPAGETGNTLASFTYLPAYGDRVDVFVADSAGSGWITATVAELVPSAGSCPLLASGGGAWTLRLMEPLALPAGSVLRFTRVLRLSAYRSGDGNWYLGLKEWDSQDGRFSGIQPIAGPIQPVRAEKAQSGLEITYRDASGALLPAPVNCDRIATVTVVLRAITGESARIPGSHSADAPFVLDSSTAVIPLRVSP